MKNPVFISEFLCQSCGVKSSKRKPRRHCANVRAVSGDYWITIYIADRKTLNILNFCQPCRVKIVSDALLEHDPYNIPGYNWDPWRAGRADQKSPISRDCVRCGVTFREPKPDVACNNVDLVQGDYRIYIMIGQGTWLACLDLCPDCRIDIVSGVILWREPYRGAWDYLASMDEVIAHCSA